MRQGLFLLSAKLLSNADFGFDADFGHISLIFDADFGFRCQFWAYFLDF